MHGNTIFGRISLAVLVAFLTGLTIVLSPSPAQAIDIEVVYTPNAPGAVDPCEPVQPACVDGEDPAPKLLSTMQQAAEHWMDIIEDPHSITISFFFADINDPDSLITEVDDAGRPTEARIRVPVNRAYYYDPFPALDDEFAMVPRLFRTLHPTERAEAVSGDPPPEVFEVAYTGQGPSADLFTIITHEMEHSLGLASNVSSEAPTISCTQASPFFVLDSTYTGGANIAIRAYEKADGTSDCSHLDLGGITECKTDPAQSPLSEEASTVPGLTVYECTSHQSLNWVSEYPNSRLRPSITDILSLAAAAPWSEIDLPRKYSLTSGNWDDPDTWLGAREPDSNDDVFLLNQLSDVLITAFGQTHARNITISDGNGLMVLFEGMTAPGTIRVTGAGSSLTVDSGALLDAGVVVVGSETTFDVGFNGTAELVDLISFGTVFGQGTVHAFAVANGGILRANGGTFTFIAIPGGTGFDLDGGQGGSVAGAVLEATTGDLVFDGPVFDQVRGSVLVGPGRRITFTEGWEYEYGLPVYELHLNGTGTESTIAGDTGISGGVRIDGRGRFTDNAEFRSSSTLALDIAGTTEVAQHDQLRVDGHATFGGTLALTFAPAYVAQAGDAFVLARYASRSGYFASVTGVNVGAGRELALLYGPTELRAEVRLIGDTNGDGSLSGTDIAALNKQLGPCPALPALCPGDLDDDGDVDVADRLILIGLIQDAKVKKALAALLG